MLTTVGLILIYLLSNIIVGAVAYKSGRLDAALEREWDVEETHQDAESRSI